MLRRTLTPDVRYFQAFEASARHMSFTLAAVELNLTQSAVSKQVRELEQQLQLALFERVRQRLVLTDAGRRFLPEVREILARIEHATLDVMALRGRRNTLSIATLPTFGMRWLVPRMPEFLRRNPDIQVDIASRSAPFDFDVERFDLAIHYGAAVWPQGQCRFLCRERVLPLVSDKLLDALSTTLAVAGQMLRDGATGLKLLHLRERPKLWAQWFELRDIEALQPFSGPRFDQFGFLIAAALAGAGVALLPTYMVEEELASGKLMALDNRPMETDLAYYTVRPLKHLPSPLCDAFQSWLHGQVGSGA